MDIIRHKPKKSTSSGPYYPPVEIEDGNIRQLYISAQGPQNPINKEIYLGDISGQARVSMDNIKNVTE